MGLFRAIRSFFLSDDPTPKMYDVKMNLIDITGDRVAIVDVDDEPVNSNTTHPISSNWAYDYEKEQEELQALRDLESAYDTIMVNERHTSNRRGYEVR